MTVTTAFKSPLHQMAMTTTTDFWNDSCSVSELTYAIEHGAVGATSNPTIVLTVLKQEMHLWSTRVQQIIAENPTWSEDEITWQVIEEVAVHGSRLLLPIYEREDAKKGLLSIQTNPANYRNVGALVAQALHFSNLAPNLQIKIPVTAAGVQAIEEVTYQGVNINATVSFTVPQALAVAEAVERGLNRRSAEGKPIDHIRPVCTIMVGRVDDWMNAVVTRDNITVHPDSLNWAGVAVMKNVYRLYLERGYRTRLLGGAYRSHLHWSEFIGGDLVLTIPSAWQKRFNASDIRIEERITYPVHQGIIDDLHAHIPDFHKAYDPDGLSIPEFDSYGATVRTLRVFLSSYYELVGLIREMFMLPNPDVR